MQTGPGTRQALRSWRLWEMANSRATSILRARRASMTGRVGSMTVGGGDRRGLVARLTPPSPIPHSGGAPVAASSPW